MTDKIILMIVLTTSLFVVVSKTIDLQLKINEKIKTFNNLQEITFLKFNN